MISRKTVVFIVGVVLCIYNPQFLSAQRSKKTVDGKLDNIELRCLYSFSQKVGSGDGFIIAVDSMMLETGKVGSVYYNWLEEYQDSLFRSHMPDITTIKQINILSDAGEFTSVTGSGKRSVVESIDKRETARIYKDRNKKNVVTIEKEVSHPGAQYLECSENFSINWDILTDTLTVAGYPCQKATTTFRGRNYTAWFTVEIPIDDGPWKLYGLPGLILKAEDDEGFFQFLAVGLEKASGMEEITIEDNLKIKSTVKQLEKIRQNRLSEKFSVHSNGGNVTFLKQDNPLKYSSLELN